MYGKIKVYTGCMYSGKTSGVLDELDKYKIARKNCVYVKFNKDTRYDYLAKNNGIVTHNGRENCNHKIICTDKLSTIFTELLKYDAIGIDEAQFYPDSADIAQLLANHGKVVICACLSSDSKGDPFPQVNKLGACAEELIKCHAICMKCFEQADFTIALADISTVDENGNNYKIGGADDYNAVCRKCMWNL